MSISTRKIKGKAAILGQHQETNLRIKAPIQLDTGYATDCANSLPVSKNHIIMVISLKHFDCKMKMFCMLKLIAYIDPYPA